MKYIIILLLLCNLQSLAQKKPDFEMPIYFEDAIGNRDTIYWGFDSEAECNFGSNFGMPVPIFGEKYWPPLTPFKNDFEVRFEYFGPSSAGIVLLDQVYYTDKWIQCARKQNDCLEWGTPNAGYMVMHALHYPVKMIYDHQKMNDALCTPRGALIYKNALQHLIGPNEIELVSDSMYICLSAADTIIFETKEDTHVNYNLLLENGDTTTAPYYELIYARDNYYFLNLDIVFCKDVLINVNDEAHANIQIYPNPAINFINIIAAHKNLRFNLYNAAGKLVLTEKVYQQKVNIQHLHNGIYTFLILDDVNDELLYIKKILKL